MLIKLGVKKGKICATLTFRCCSSLIKRNKLKPRRTALIVLLYKVKFYNEMFRHIMDTVAGASKYDHPKLYAR
jgi:hypothetical protein